MRRTPTPPWEPHAAQLQTPSGALFLFGFVPLLLLLPLLGRFGAAGFAVQMEADEAQQSRQQRQAQQWEQPVQRPPPTAGTGQSHQLHLEAQHRIACRAEVEMGNKGGWGGWGGAGGQRSPGMVGGEPRLPYARWGGMVALRFSLWGGGVTRIHGDGGGDDGNVGCAEPTRPDPTCVLTPCPDPTHVLIPYVS